MRTSTAVALVAAVSAGAALLAFEQDGQVMQRTVFVTAFDQTGAALADLSAADLTVKVGGREVNVVRVEPSRSRLKVALAVEEALTPDNFVRRALAGFIDGIHEAGDVALYVVGRRPERRVDYTSEIMPFVEAINAFPARGMPGGNLVESVYEIAKEQRQHEGRRVIVTLATETRQSSTMGADGVVEQLSQGRGVFYAVTLTGFEEPSEGSEATSGGRRLSLERQVSGLERERLFTEGTKESGGLHLPVHAPNDFPAALGRIVGDLRNQYVVTYVPPPGHDADERLSVTAAKGRSLIVRGPRRVSAK